MRSNLKQAIRNIALGGAIAAISSGSFAATDGTVGFTSTGDLDIELVVADEVRISGMSDLTLNFSGTDETATSDACIYRNSGTAYQITGTGDGAGNAFELTDGTNIVPFAVTIDDGDTSVSMPAGSAVTRTNADQLDTDCFTNGPNAQISVTVTAANALALPAASYLGTLTLLVAPI